jgi:CelD/BcsL family acetyltransferase involved in cellulose biosynthesis
VAIYSLDPIVDPRWSEFVDRHASASIVHTPEWLCALKRTYGYRPVVYTTSAPGSTLTNGAVLCRVSSWLTGRRWVSLPFTDHCELLVDSREREAEILEALHQAGSRERLRYIELRALGLQQPENSDWKVEATYCLHVLDLQPSLDDIFRATHKTAVQQAIRRAEREQLEYSDGRSEALLDEFYRLLLLTRRRHNLPPQPIQWFRNLIVSVGDRLKIRVASKDGKTVASILTFQWGDTIHYKYGCSDAQFHNLGGIAMLLWKTIQEGKASGARGLDFGRSDLDNPGLITFKDRWGAKQSVLSYVRHSRQPAKHAGAGRGARLAQQVFARMPDEMLVAAGRLLYRHIA